MKKNTLLFIFLSAMLLSACSNTSYKMDIQQGNVVEEETLNQVTMGMSRAQVQDILGTSLLQDDFHSNRWDYVFSLKKAGKKVERKSAAIIFNGDAVSQILR